METLWFLVCLSNRSTFENPLFKWIQTRNSTGLAKMKEVWVCPQVGLLSLSTRVIRIKNVLTSQEDKLEVSGKTCCPSFADTRCCHI
jgi:hypothetical protein